MKTIRVATYNIHKGVQGMGPQRRLEIHNLADAVGQFNADIVCLQEVGKHHRGEEEYFTRWPDMPQADFLAPDGYEVGLPHQRLHPPRRAWQCHADALAGGDPSA